LRFDEEASILLVQSFSLFVVSEGSVLLHHLFGSARRKAFVVLVTLLTAGGILVGVQSASAATPGAKYNTSKKCEQFWDTKSSKLQAFKSYAITVNGKTIPKDKWNVSEYVKANNEVSITFELKPECDNTYVAISMYQAPQDHFVPSQAKQQKLVQRVGGAFKAGKKHTLTAKTPNCYFQMDINTGWEYKPGDYTLDHRGRLVMAANGGSKKCTAATTTTKKPTTTTKKPTTTTAKPTTTTVKPTTTTKKPTTTTSETVKPQETTTTRKPTTTTSEKATTTTEKPTTTTKVEVAESKADVKQVCVVEDATKSGYVVTLKNTGDVKEIFTITQDGEAVPGSPYTVAPGDTKAVLLPLKEDQKAEVAITGQESDLAMTKTVTLDCLPTAGTTTTTEKPAEVLPKTIEKKPELAETGFSVFSWVLFGGCFLAIGVGLVKVARRVSGNE
jgi:hypothetical protein